VCDLERRKAKTGGIVVDVSSNYIKMCEKAVEIQEPWVISGRNIGDFYYNLHTHHRDIWKAHNKLASDFDIWLPRQDQLQEMLFPDITNMNWILNKLIEFSGLRGIESDSNVYYAKRFNSMEQLWLAYVMKEKYNKAWNGKDWEKANLLEYKAVKK